MIHVFKMLCIFYTHLHPAVFPVLSVFVLLNCHFQIIVAWSWKIYNAVGLATELFKWRNSRPLSLTSGLIWNVRRRVMSADSCDAYAHARTYTCSRGAKNSLWIDAWMDGWEAARLSLRWKTRAPPTISHQCPAAHSCQQGTSQRKGAEPICPTR